MDLVRGYTQGREHDFKKVQFMIIRSSGAAIEEPKQKNVTVEVNVVPHGDGGAPDLNGPLHGFKDG